ncbi:MAG: hypothetical protein GY866_23285 [Proteobacteria bacterium]|nr:hypothetical protein [Pseudomonadota bacterium]
MVKYMKDLSSPEQKWLAKAVVTIILADGIIEKDQVSFIKKLCTVFMDEEPKDTLNEISSLLREKQIPKLEELEVNDADHLNYMLDVLSASVFVNGKKLRQETERFFEAGKKIGLYVGTLSYRLSLEAEKFRVKRKLMEIKEELKQKLETEKE